jgi:hypothetical protein
MASAGRDPDAAAGGHQRIFTLDLDQDFAGENIEKLLSAPVIVAIFCRAWRHEFFDHAELSIFDEVPSVAGASPAIVFGVFSTHGTGLRSGFIRHAVRLRSHQCSLERMNQPKHPEQNSTDAKRGLLRHTLATLAYRGGKAVRHVPDGFAEFHAGQGLRTPGQILAHIGDLMDWGLSIAKGQQKWQNSPPLPWEREVERFFAALRKLDDFLASSEPVQVPVEKLFQGPVADALTHVGQIAILRRLAGAPVKGENYYAADIETGRVGADQAKPKREF